jgi:major membrane immunogen (membrane-anchored lipoprotein)
MSSNIILGGIILSSLVKKWLKKISYKKKKKKRKKKVNNALYKVTLKHGKIVICTFQVGLYLNKKPNRKASCSFLMSSA